MLKIHSSPFLCYICYMPVPTHLWQETRVALQQQGAQLCSAQVLQPVLQQDLPVVSRVQVMREEAAAPAIEHTQT